ncbi:uncharacterized protein LOC114239395 [Bombyx mandarina]|uniref:Uncharacterized protein LOC114239395 n=1 Tax=Bombyx mandarina TaxID=7092 RepID=A0A6J2J7J6_BOMMA|nr:uncharacterized protein LOC114239395 [Bombyx mandarina]
MTAVTENCINSIMTQIASKYKFTNWQYSRNKFECLAQNYFGILIPVVLTGYRAEKYIEIPIVLKLAPTNEKSRVSGAVTAMFAREIYIYTSVFEVYQEMQQNCAFTSKIVIPKCYLVCKEFCKEFIALENMCTQGYKPFTTGMFLNLEHIIVSLKTLARFHAFSFILKETNKNTYDEITKVCIPLTEKSNKRYIDIMIDRLSKALDKFKETEYVPLLQTLKDNCVTYFQEAIDLVKGKCICHGDIWKENILFKYEGNVPVNACLIDYQTSRESSPAIDTLYLIISSTDTELRQKHFHKLLDTYFQTFDQMLSEATLDKVYSREMFNNDLKIVWPACLITANTALWLSSGLQQEGHVRSKLVWNTSEEMERAVNNYKNKIKSIINDFCSYGFLNLETV